MKLVQKTAGAAVDEASSAVLALRAELEQVRKVAHETEQRRGQWVAILAWVIREQCGSRIVVPRAALDAIATGRDFIALQPIEGKRLDTDIITISAVSVAHLPPIGDTTRDAFVDALNASDVEHADGIWTWRQIKSDSFGAVLMVRCPSGHITVVNHGAYAFDEPVLLTPGTQGVDGKSHGAVRAVMLTPSFICSSAPTCEHHVHLRLIERDSNEAQPDVGVPSSEAP